MDGKITRLLEPRLQFYFFVMLCFAALSAVFNLYIAAAEAAAVILLFIYYRVASAVHRKEILRYIESVTYDVDSASKDTMLNCPLPMVIFNPLSDEVIWSNERFLQIAGRREHLFDTKIAGAVPGFSSRWIMEGKTECPQQVALGERQYLVFGHLVRTDSGSGRGLLATTYWIDITELSSLRDRFFQRRATAAIVVLDNYEELLKGMSENARSAVLSQLDERMEAWAAPTNGILRKYDRDRYLFFFEEQYLSVLAEAKFALLDLAHEVLGANGIPATVSIGIGKDADTFHDLFQFASLSIEMALSRGGDQVVIKNRFSFEFFGGRAKELERRTKVKSRVMSNALGGLIEDSSRVLIMGHKSPDMDSIGAAAGLVAIARKFERPANIVIEPDQTLSGALIDRLRTLPEYASVFITPQDALIFADARTLLVVVDTSRPEQVQSEDLLLSCTRVALIDHHRRAATYIANAVLSFHEPYASSASELTTELLQYLLEPADFLRVEAEALLAGIVLDTKSFTVRTGSRTFEAAAFLRRAGADTADVKQYFRNDLSGAIAKYEIIRTAKIHRDGIAIAMTDQTVGRIAAAQAADELLSIAGITASFVLCPEQDHTIVSARSLSEVNVQIICEALGGGGNAAAAGAQLSASPEEARGALTAAIDRYLDE